MNTAHGTAGRESQPGHTAHDPTPKKLKRHLRFLFFIIILSNESLNADMPCSYIHYTAAPTKHQLSSLTFAPAARTAPRPRHSGPSAETTRHSPTHRRRDANTRSTRRTAESLAAGTALNACVTSPGVGTGSARAARRPATRHDIQTACCNTPQALMPP